MTASYKALVHAQSADPLEYHTAEVIQDSRVQEPGIPEIIIDGSPFLGHGGVGECSRVAIAIDPVALITTECITVTSAMRKHARWAHSSVSAILGGSSPTSYRHGPLPTQAREKLVGPRQHQGGASSVDLSAANEDESLASRWGLRGKKGKSMQDNPLMSAFARLRSDLRGSTGTTPHILDMTSRGLRGSLRSRQIYESSIFPPFFIRFCR